MHLANPALSHDIPTVYKAIKSLSLQPRQAEKVEVRRTANTGSRQRDGFEKLCSVIAEYLEPDALTVWIFAAIDTIDKLSKEQGEFSFLIKLQNPAGMYILRASLPILQCLTRIRHSLLSAPIANSERNHLGH
jgi:hypothetical protein